MRTGSEWPLGFASDERIRVALIIILTGATSSDATPAEALRAGKPIQIERGILHPTFIPQHLNLSSMLFRLAVASTLRDPQNSKQETANRESACHHDHGDCHTCFPSYPIMTCAVGNGSAPRFCSPGTRGRRFRRSRLIVFIHARNT
jgi:hypothetical protein